jgi:hypothetical protein
MEERVAAPVEKSEITADHTTPSVRKNWHSVVIICSWTKAMELLLLHLL